MSLDNKSAIFPTGNGYEAMIIHKHSEAVEYVKKRYKKQSQFDKNDTWRVVFKTQTQVTQAINHVIKKFKFDVIENWQ